MAFEALQAEIGLLLTQMQNEPEDRHELAMQIREKLAELRAFGMPLPEDLVALEQALEAPDDEDGETPEDGTAKP